MAEQVFQLPESDWSPLQSTSSLCHSNAADILCAALGYSTIILRYPHRKRCGIIFEYKFGSGIPRAGNESWWIHDDVPISGDSGPVMYILMKRFGGCFESGNLSGRHIQAAQCLPSGTRRTSPCFYQVSCCETT